ncbi:MAG: restriction endonuclease subunit S [Gammaproteobacteria bacterium]|nr:restriction endonuclease subunit S [Gammaproteobacteria bacterium]
MINRPSKLGIIPKDWKKVKFSEVMKVRQGLQIPISKRLKHKTETSKEYITIQSIKNTNQEREYVDNPSSRVVCDKNHVLMTRTGNTGIVVTGVEGVFHNNFFLMNFDYSIINKKFLIEYLETTRVQHVILTKAGASTIPDLNHKDFYSIEFPLPPLAEQIKIAEILSTWDKAIGITEQLLANSEQQKRALMQQLLTGQKRLKDENGNVFCGDWGKVELGSILDYKQPTPYLVKSTNYSDEYKTPVLTAGKTFLLGYTDENFGIYKNNLPVIIFDDFTTATKFVDFPFKVKSSAMKILTTKNNNSIKYVYEAMQILNYSIGGHQRHWISIFSYLVINLPPLAEQQAIATVLTAADKQINSLKQQLEKLQLEKKSLMQMLLSGRIRVKLTKGTV